MTHLNIQQGLNIEVVSTNLIKKLYEAALSVPEPLEGELDAAYMSGNLLVDKSYRALVEYLTNRFDDLHINVTGDYYINFADPLVLSVLLANNFSSDGVGVTESDAASANLLVKFANNSNITTFNEFKYFTDTNKIDHGGAAQTFINCTNLSEIDLTEWEVALLRLFDNTAITTVNAPKLSRYGSGWGGVGVFQSNSHLTTVQSLGHITKIVSNMFGGCINLATVNLPQECTTIEQLAFIISYNQGGGHLATINLDNITTIGLRAFQELRRLAKTLPTDMPSLISIGDYAFEYCVALTGSINYPNLTSLGEGSFHGCTGITSILDLGSVTYIPGGCFLGCTNLTSVNLSGVTSIGRSAFEGDTSLSGNIEITLTDALFELNIFKNCPINKLIVHGNNLGSNWGNIGNLVHSWWVLPNCTYIDLSDTKIELGKVAQDTQLVTIVFPTTINNVPWDAMDRCPALLHFILTGATPPSSVGDLSLYMFKNQSGPNAHIYVPDNSLSSYQASFSTVSSRIKPISELPSSITWATKS